MKVYIMIALLLMTGKLFAFENGNEFIDYCSEIDMSKYDSSINPSKLQFMKSMYCTGFMSGMIAGLSVKCQGNIQCICLPEGFSPRQGILMVLEFLKKNPHELHMPASYLVSKALSEKFLCEDFRQKK